MTPEVLGRDARREARPPLPPIEAAQTAVTDRCPTSFAQERLWFWAQRYPASPAYNLTVSIGLEGEPSVGALEQALNALVGRHESLRSTFLVDDGISFVRIADELDIECPLEDLSSLPEPEREEALGRLIEREARRPFDLEEGPVIRAALARLGEARHALLVSMHEIVSDRWSSGILVRELGELYSAYAKGDEPGLAPPPIQYRDYASWQRSQLRGTVLQELEAYWKERIGRDSPGGELLGDRPRPRKRRYEGASRELDLDGELIARLGDVGSARGASLYMTLLSAAKALLSRQSGEVDVVVGTTIANRHHEKTEALIGPLENTLVLRSNLSGASSFVDVLDRVRATVLEAHEHRDYPFERLVDVVRPARRGGRTPFFDVMFRFDEPSGRPPEFDGLRAESRVVRNGTERFDLTIEAEVGSAEKPGEKAGAKIRLGYDTDVLDEATIESLLGGFEEILQGVAEDPERPILDDRGDAEAPGHGIDPGEIEAALATCPGVQECAVVVRGESADDRKLVAYVVRREARITAATALGGGDEVEVTSDDLRRHAEAKLPATLAPSSFVFLDSLPRSSGGDVDRSALPEPQDEVPAVAFVAPRNPLESQIADIWKEVLEVDRIGVHENFFQAGGHSLVATLLMSRLREECSIDLPLRRLFEAPTVAELSAAVETARRGDQVAQRRYEDVFDASLIPLQPRGERTPLYLVSGAHAKEDDFLRFVGSLLPHMGPDQPIYGFKARGLDGVQEPHDNVPDMAADYIQELRSFQPAGPYLLAGNCVGGIVAYEMAQQLRRAGQDVRMVALLDTSLPRQEYADYVGKHFSFWRKDRFAQHWDEVRSLPLKEQFGSAIHKVVRRLKKTFPLTDAARKMRHVERVEWQYSVILSRYQPEPYAGKLTVINNEELDREDVGWAELAGGGLERHVVPGDHVTRLSMHGGLTAEALKSSIEKALAGTGEETPVATTTSGAGAPGRG